MKRLFNIEAQKIINYKTARFFIGSYFILLTLAAISLSQEFNLFGMEVNLGDMDVFSFPNVWHFIAYFAAIAKLFLAIILITNVTNEYSYGTIKQNLIDGLTKREFVLSKTITNVFFSLASTGFVFIVATVLGLYFTEGEYSFFQDFEYIPAYFLKLITFFSFCIFLSFLVRKSAFAFALFFVWWILEAVISGIEILIRVNAFNEHVKDISSHALSNYLPLNAMSNLVPSPFKRIKVVDMMTQGQMNDLNINPSYVVVCILYFVLFTYLSYWLVKRRDL